MSIWYGVDPLADEFPGRSPYEYTFSNPVRFTDPTGMAPEQGGDDLDAYIQKRGGVNAFGPQKPKPTGNDWQNKFEQWNYRNEVTAWNKLSASEKSQRARMKAGLQLLNEAFKEDAQAMAGLFQIQSYLGGSGMANGSGSFYSRTLSIEDKIQNFAERVNIYSAAKKGLNKTDGISIIEKYYGQMEAGTFNKGGAGFITKDGQIVLTEGNHSMNAAIKYALKKGDPKYIKLIIEKGNFTKNANLKDYGIKKVVKLPTK